MAFQDKTRRRIIPMPSKAKGTESPLQFRISKAGILAGIMLDIQGTLAGTLSNLNALGKASVISRVRVSINSGVELHSFTGPQYHYLIRDQLEDFKDVVPFTDARSAVAAAAYNVSMYIPIAINLRDPIGLFMLQNEQTEVVVSVEFEADANIATGITSHTATVQPHLIIFSTPENKQDWPDFSILHSIIAESRAIAATGEQSYKLLRGNTYLGLYAAYGMGVSGSDKFDAVSIRALQSDRVETWNVAALNMGFSLTHGRARLAGTIPLDWIGTSGLGSYGSARDAIPSALISDLELVVNATAQPDTLHLVRRQLIHLQ